MSLPHVKTFQERETKLVQCEICDTEYLPVAHMNHCPICGTAKLDVGTKHHIFVNVQNGRFVGRPFRISRSLAETINSLAVTKAGV